MRRLVILALLAVIGHAGLAGAQDTAPRRPLGILVTNWGCAPCAPANQALDAWYPAVADQFSLIRVHCWWPAGNDPIYLENVPQSRYLIWDTPNGPDTAPHLWIDNVADGGTYADQMVGHLEARSRVPAPLTIDLAWDESAEEITATIDVINDMPVSEYRLFVAVTEDSVAAQGPNGEPFHNQALRYLYPDTLGVPVDHGVGQHEIPVPTPLQHDRWHYPHLRATAYVQDRATGEVQNSASIVLAGAATAAPPMAPDELALTAYPNPFNPTTRVVYTVPAAKAVTVRVHDLTGRVVRTLVDGSRPAGEHAAIWRGRDTRGRAVAAGVYLVRVQAGREAVSRKVVLAK